MKNTLPELENTLTACHDEDYLSLLECSGEHIRYVRNYSAQVEFVILSQGLVDSLPSALRPISNVFVSSNFWILKRFKERISQYVLNSGNTGHFQHLFDANLDEFWERL